MPASPCKPSLSVQILTALSCAGPLTIDQLHRATIPQVDKKCLRQSLGILQRKRQVTSVTLDIHWTFYFLSVPEVTLADNESLLRRPDKYHSHFWEFWAAQIKRHTQRIEMNRGQTPEELDLVKNILKINLQDFVIRPDFLLSFQNESSAQSITVALEIERTRKSNATMLHKLRRYLTKTNLDGLIFISDSGLISETIRTLYEDGMCRRATRVKDASKFFIFSDCKGGGGPRLDRFFTPNGELISLTDWIGRITNVGALHT